MRILVATIALLFVAGCTLDPPFDPADAGSTTGLLDDGGRGTGALSGQLAFPVNGAFQIHYLDKSSGAFLGFGVDLVEHALGCAELQGLDGGTVPGPFRDLRVSVVAGQDSTGPAPGTYQVVSSVPSGSGFVAVVTLSQVNADGSVSGPFTAQSGQVTLSASSADGMSGTFSAEVPDANGLQTPLSGQFNAPYCP